MSRSTSPLNNTLYQAAQAICEVLDENGYRDAYMFTGEAAQCIYMSSLLTPPKLEIVFLQKAPAPSLKQLIHSLDPYNFTHTKDQGEEKLHWCSPLSTPSTIEVAFLAPSPAFHDAGIQLVDHYPLIPFPHLVLHGVLAWHRATRMADRTNFAGQVSSMLQFLHTRPDLGRPIASIKALGADIVPIVERFYFNYPGHLEEWHALGFLLNRSSSSSQASSKHPPNLPTLPTTSGSKRSTTPTQSQASQPQPPAGTTVPTPPRGQASGSSGKPRNRKGKKKEGRNAAPTNTGFNSGNGNRQQASKPPVTTTPSTRHPASNSRPSPTQRIGGAIPTAQNTTTNPNPPSHSSKRANAKGTNGAQIPAQRLTPHELRNQAAQTTISILRRLRFTSALFGSMACHLFGNQRSPNDIEVLAVPPSSNSEISREGVKHLLFEHCLEDSHFILIDNHDGDKNNRLLYWIPGSPPKTRKMPQPQPQVENHGVGAGHEDALALSVSGLSLRDCDTGSGNRLTRLVNGKEFPRSNTMTNKALCPPPPNAVRVNVFIPGTMNLPAMPASLIIHRGPLSLPCVPYPLLLVLKLQEWSEHNTSDDFALRNKIPEDLSDLRWLLGTGMKQNWNTWANWASLVTRDTGGYRDYFDLDPENRGREKSVVGVWGDRRLFSEELEILTRERAREISWEHPDMSKGLLEVGLQPS